MFMFSSFLEVRMDDLEVPFGPSSFRERDCNLMSPGISQGVANGGECGILQMATVPLMGAPEDPSTETFVV